MEKRTTSRESTSNEGGISRRGVLRGMSALGAAGLGLTPSLTGGRVQAQNGDATTFASIPDMFNWDIANPQTGWEDALDWFFDQLTTVEGAEFALSAGDIMDARWWGDKVGDEDDKQFVRTNADEYWVGYKDRFEEVNLPVYVAPGDHERGDNDWPDWKLDLVPTFESKFTEIFDHPTNGPEGKKELAYYFVKDNALFVTVDTWELENGNWSLSVTGDQLEWFRNVLSNHQDKDFIIVQGHVPVTNVNSRNSSALTLDGGRSSQFWNTMQLYDVDAYLCGEHHDITVEQIDGIWQIVHGSLWGTHTDLNYLVGRVGSDTLELEVKEFFVEYSGDYIDQINRGDTNAPREEVSITSDTLNNGPTTFESVTIDSSSENTNDEGCPVVKTVPDLTDNGNDGVIEGDVSQVSAKDGQGLEFNGGYVTVEESSSVDVTDPPLTVECWVKPTDPQDPDNGEGYEPYVTKVGDTGQYSLHRTSFANDADGQLEFAIASGGDFFTPRSPVPTPWQGTWHHLAGVYDGNTVKLYVDGTEKDSVTAPNSLNDTDGNVEVGRNFGNPTRKLTDGTVVDRVRIHRAALTASELDQSDPTASENPVLWFDFESINTDTPGAPSGVTYLSDHEAIDFTVGYTFEDFGRDEAVTGFPLQVDGEIYEKGIGTHAPSQIRYCLGEKMDRFKALVGMDEKGGEFTGGDAGGDGVIFRVLGDGLILDEKGPIKHPDPPELIDVDVSDVSVLTLVADGGGDTSYDHADWLNARVIPPVSPLEEGAAKPQDLDDDGLYEDVDGDGNVTNADLEMYADNIDDESLQGQTFAFDYNQNGRIDHDDLVTLFEEEF